MKLYFPLFLFFCAFAVPSFAGGIKGSVKNESGQALEFATIFVKETGSGTTTNIEGYFELRLPPGDYTVIFQYLGYEAKVEKIAIGEMMKDIDIVLKAQTLELKQVDVIEGREDPAYTVMRKAIAKASYHRQQIDTYSAQVYIKGSGRLKNSPFFLRKMLKEEGIDSSFAFVSESVSKIEYTRPNKFKETVISIRKQGDDNSTSPNSYIFNSFYQPEIAEAISPLSPQAFAYYKFKLDGYFVDRGYGVNQIRVIPRSRGENVFEGTIYIVEDWWSIHSLSLKTYKLGIEFQVNQVYAPIDGKAWLPVSHKFDVDGKILGFNFEYNYLATASNYKITLNPDLPADVMVIDEKLDKELAKEVEKRRKEDAKVGDIYDKLSSGKELTRKDLRKMMKDYEKEEKNKAKEEHAQSKPDSVKVNDPFALEERSFSVDSMAYKRDSSYWEEIRPIPLTQYEVKGYHVADSTAIAEAKERERIDAGEEEGDVKNDQKKKKKTNGFSIGDLVVGGSYKVGKNQQLSFQPLASNLFFNPVEGFSLHSEIAYRITDSRPRTDHSVTIGSDGNASETNSRPTPSSRRFEIGITPRYAFARETLTAKGRISYYYGPRFHRSRFDIDGGRYIFQYNSEKPISELINTYLNLIEERNYIRLYEKDYLHLNFDHQLQENWRIMAGAEWAKRYTLENNTTQTWFNRGDRAYDSNIPANDEVSYPFPDTEKALLFNIGVETRPWQKYRTYNGRTQVIENTSPTFTLQYRKGLPGILGSDVNYDLLDFTYRHKFNIGARGKMDVKVNSGIFLNDEKVGFADYKHFNGNRIVLVTADPVGSFRLLDYYRYSTADKYVSAHAHYQFRKFLFTQIPEVWLLGIKENLFVNYLATPTSKNYVELGYSIDNIFKIFRLEGAVSFYNGKYQDWGVLIGIASNLGFVSFD